MSNKTIETNSKALVKVNNGGFFKRFIAEIEQPLKSTVESAGQLTENIIVTSAHTVDLSTTTLNIIVEGVGSSAKLSSDTLKKLDIDSTIKSLTVDLLKDKK